MVSVTHCMFHYKGAYAKQAAALLCYDRAASINNGSMITFEANKIKLLIKRIILLGLVYLLLFIRDSKGQETSLIQAALAEDVTRSSGYKRKTK